MHIRWPRAWEADLPRKKVILTILVCIGGPFFLFAGMMAIAAEDYGIGWTSLIAFVAVVLMGIAGYLNSVAPRTRRSGATYVEQTRDGTTVTTFKHRSTAKYAQLAIWASLLVVLVTMPFLAAITPYDGTRQSAAYHAFAPFAPVFAIYPAGVLLSRLVRRRGLIGLQLSAGGVYHWWWFGCSYFSWDWILSVRASVGSEVAVLLDIDEPEKRPMNPEENFVGRWPAYRKRRAKVAVTILDVNPAVAYLALAFYQRHPELRSELGTQASVERIQRMDFPELVKEIEQYGDLRTPESTRD